MSQLPVEILSVGDVERLLTQPDLDDVFGLRDAAILGTLYYAAATASELVSMDIRDIDLDEGWLRLTGDDGRRRRVRLEEPLVRVLGRYLEESRRPLIAQSGIAEVDEVSAVFVTNRGQRIHVQDVRQILGTYAKAADLTTAVSYNLLRLSRAWHLREAGTPPEEIQKLLGTSSRSGRRLF